MLSKMNHNNNNFVEIIRAITDEEKNSDKFVSSYTTTQPERIADL